jgi:glucokinase
MQKPLSIGIDIGGTKTAYGFITESGDIIFKGEAETGDSPDPNELVSRLTTTLFSHYKSIQNEYKLIGAGVGAPKANYYKGTVEHAANLSWQGVIPLANLFSKALSIPVTLTNDANAGALGELYFGSAKGMKDFIFITLGTGLGSGLIANGELINGHHGFAGELGHTTIIQHGRTCTCGKKGCLEQYCSATGIVKTYLEILRNDGRPFPENDEVQKIDAKYIYEKALCGDEAAFYAFNYTGELLGFALANAAAYMDPEAIFLFGGLARAEEILLNPVIISFEKNLLGIYKNKIKILRSGLPENDAALLGASSLVWDERKKTKVKYAT